MNLAQVGRRSPTAPGGNRTRGVHYPCFDGLRALAALTVIGVHTSFETGFTTKHPGWGRYTSRLEIGVEVFFVISGFLLYRPFAVAHFGGRPAPPLKQFWTRRLKRIIPAYWVAFLVATYLLRADSGGPGWKGPLIYMGFAQIYFPTYILHGLSQAWSLCTEVTFYLALPFYAAALGRGTRDLRAQLRAELAGLAALTAATYLYLIPVCPRAYRDYQLHHHKAIAPTMPSWLPGNMALFALGMLLAVASAWLAATGERPRWLWHPALPWVSWFFALLMLWAVSNIGLPLTPVTPSPLGASLARQTLYGLFGFFIVVPAVFGEQDRGLIRAALRWRPVVFVGVVSYGVYLWHEGWMHMYFTWTGDRLFNVPWLHMTAAITVLAVAAAAASYFLVERPILRSGRNRSSQLPAGGWRLRRAPPDGGLEPPLPRLSGAPS